MYGVEIPEYLTVRFLGYRSRGGFRNDFLVRQTSNVELRS